MSLVPILVAGHYCHDTLYLANGTCNEALGGSASYISSVFSSLEVKYQTISKVGPDFSYLSQVLSRPQVVSSHPTTHFIADFSTGERVARVGALCDAIYPEDIPQDARFE